MDADATPNPPRAARVGSHRGRNVILLSVAILALVVLGIWQPWRDPGLPSGTDTSLIENPAKLKSSDPRLTCPTPYRNVRPEVKYVGDGACAGCHTSQSDNYRQHPMGRSFAMVANASPLERYDLTAHNPFKAGLFTYRIEQEKDKVRHAETLNDSAGRAVAETSAAVHFVVGSGNNGRAYLIDHDGYLFASPITWYPRKGIWDLSPGYEKTNPHFGRPINPSCLFCHANHADQVSGTMNRYRASNFHGEAIGCERCHGPGELHVQRRAEALPVTGLDETIVNPSKLEHSLREAVCQQCHLQGQQRILRRGLNTFDFRPGLPLCLFSSDFIKPPEESDTKFVGSVEQMYASQCFSKSTGSKKLGCISCHDPHSVPAAERKASFYRERCLDCHKDKGCSLPLDARLKKEDSCYACHMPPTGSNINHTTISDHRIVRTPQSSPIRGQPSPAGTLLVHFHQNLLPTPDPESERDLGIALVQYADSLPSGDMLSAVIERALPYLEKALSRDEQDLPALEAKGNALWFLSRLNESIGCYEQVLKVDPEREMTLYRAASLSLRLGRV
jgi:hypothetical protein